MASDRFTSYQSVYVNVTHITTRAKKNWRYIVRILLAYIQKTTEYAKNRVDPTVLTIMTASSLAKNPYRSHSEHLETRKSGQKQILLQLYVCTMIRCVAKYNISCARDMTTYERKPQMNGKADESPVVFCWMILRHTKLYIEIGQFVLHMKWIFFTPK